MSSILRPLLLDMAEQGWFRPVWSARIGLEWRRNAARVWGVGVEVLEAQWAALEQRFPDADAGDVALYEASLRYGDPKDRHVVAAGLARRARAALQQRPCVRVLTWNLKDFDRAELRRQDMSVWDPDRQLADWAAQDPAGVAAALAGVPAYARLLERDEPVMATLRRERLFRTCRLLAEHLEPQPQE
ncbi:PIN domain-containing protein [Pigmentiphaga humi]|nr:PIN domain-containing protein [Pigmentiphaga humi]